MTPAAPVKTLTLRSVWLQPLDEDQHPFTAPLILFPLLPLRQEAPVQTSWTDGGLATGIAIPTTQREAPGFRMECWSDTYAYRFYSNGPLQGALDVSANGAPTIKPVITAGEADHRYSTRAIEYRFPVTPDVPRAERIHAIFDAATWWDYTFSGSDAPVDATQVTLQRLGVGIIRDVPLPPSDPTQPDRKPVVLLPDWMPGAIVSGQILLPDGTPFADCELTVGHDLKCSDGFLLARTDKEGRFTVRGVLPGPLFVYVNEALPGDRQQHLFNSTDLAPLWPQLSPKERQPLNTVDTWYQRLLRHRAGGWALEVPAEGLQNVTLRLSETPVHLLLPEEVLFRSQWRPSVFVWWLPDGGRPVRLPVINSTAVDAHGLAQAPGQVWCVTEEGRALLSHCTLTPGWHVIKPDPAPSLGIILPYNDKTGLPGAVTLTGLGARAGISLTCNNLTWCPSPALGVITGQIDAVPPGDYRLHIDSPTPIDTTVTVSPSGGTVMTGIKIK